MVNLVSKVAIIGVVFVGILYQFLFKDLIFDVLGYGRSVDAIHAYSHARCEKIDSLDLEGCEDMWLHEKTGYLYMACGDTKSRLSWLPAVDNLNASARTGKDRLVVLDSRGSGPVSSRIHTVTPENFAGVDGKGTLDLHGLDIRPDDNTDVLRILLVNHRPAIDSVTGELLDATKVGANSTIEQFQTKAGDTTMRHVRTYAHEVIQTPNRVAWVNDHAFVFTNDHSAKVGTRRGLDVLIGGGSVGFCSRNTCNMARSSGLSFPNGLARGRDGLIYVPQSMKTELEVFSLTDDHRLEPVTTIKGLFPIDNLSVDGNGDIFAASFPQSHAWIKHSHDPFNLNPPSAIWKISRETKGKGKGRNKEIKAEGDYVAEKVLEDNGSVLPGSTVVVHDSQTGRMFFGGAFSPFITICETR